jgi:hypothetical protein
MSRRLWAQAGQTAAEYMGVLLVVSVIIAAVATTSVGTQIRDEMKRIVCQIFGGDCGEALSDCVTAEATEKVSINGEVNVRLFTVKLEGGVEYTRQKRANGQVAMSFKLATAGGVGEKIKKHLDASIKGGPAESVTFLLADDAAANEFAQQIKDSAKAIALKPLNRFGIDGGDPHIDFPPVESLSFEQTGTVSLGSEADSAGGYGSATVEIGGALGFKRDLIKGETTAFYKVSAKGAGAAGMPVIGPGFTGALAGELSMSVTWDRHGNATKLSLRGVGGYEGGVEGLANPKDLKAALKYIDALELKADHRDGKKLEFQIDLDLDDANQSRLVTSLLTGIAPGTQAAAGLKLWNLMEQKGKIQMRHYDTDADTQSVGIDALVAGGGIAHDTTSAELTGAEDYVSGRGFVASVVCR